MKTYAEHAREISRCLDQVEKWQARLHDALAALAKEHGQEAGVDQEIMARAAAPKNPPRNPGREDT